MTAPGGAPLGKIANSVAAEAGEPPADEGGWTRSERFRAARLRRYERRQASSLWLRAAYLGTGWTDYGAVRPPRVARCSWRLASTVRVAAEVGKPARFKDVEVCASIWACPCCSAGIRERRATEIQAAANRWATQGGTVAMLTLTMRHRWGDPLKDTIGNLFAAYRRMQQSRAYRDLTASVGVVGWVRSVEVTVGDNGWHPHLHVLLFLPGVHLTPAFRDAYATAWTAALEALGARPLGPAGHRHSVRLSQGYAVALSRYISKVQDGGDSETWGIGREIARVDAKSAHPGEWRAMPFELLDADTPRTRRLWLEYFEATKGRRAIEWSRGLRKRLAVEETPDSEAAIAAFSDEDWTYLEGRVYSGMTVRQRVGVLETAEDSTNRAAN